MYVIDVIPLQRGTHIETLRYFSSVSYQIGTVVEAPVRKKTKTAIIIAVSDVRPAKAGLRAATFSLRRLPVHTTAPVLSDALLRTAIVLAKHNASSTGAVLYSLLSPPVRLGMVGVQGGGGRPFPDTPSKSAPETPEVFQAPSATRYDAYRTLVRETFAHGGSLLFVVPSPATLEYAARVLGAGIEDRVIVLGSAMTARQCKAAYERMRDMTTTTLIVATVPYACLERSDITVVIAEHARSGQYRLPMRPYLDMREVLSVYATHTRRRLIFADLLPLTEQEEARRSEQYATFGERPKRITLPGTLVFLERPADQGSNQPFFLFTPQVLAAIKNTRRNKRRTFLLAGRRGLAPAVVCGDCGYLFRSPQSGAPYSLLKQTKGTDEVRWFVCGVSGERVRAADTCASCGSWRLRGQGIGIQYVYEELSRALSGVPIVLFDKEHATTHRRAQFLRDTFYQHKDAVMIGTPMALPYLTDGCTTSVVVSLDALRATPTWRQNEEQLATLLLLRELTDDTLYVQSRGPHDALIEYAARGMVEKFYTEERALRQTFHYPPHVVFFHLTWHAPAAHADDIEVLVKDAFQGVAALEIYRPVHLKDGTGPRYGLIRIPTIDWPCPRVLKALRSLPPSVRIIKNPDRLL